MRFALAVGRGLWLDAPRMSADRLQQAFARKQPGACFVAYLCAGDPTPASATDLAAALLDEGVDILELGVPFSDPLADGLTNQLAAERALAAGMTQDQVFAQAARLREQFPDRPLVFYTYYNLVFARGARRYAEDAVAAGIDAILVLDLPPEEADEWSTICAETGLKTVFIVAPTTPPERLPVITRVTTGFIYYVSREGVTGERDSLAGDIDARVAAIKEHTGLPVVVGFGISTAAQVRTVAAAADGVVVGSALVNCIAATPNQPEAIAAALRAKARELLSGLTSAAAG